MGLKSGIQRRRALSAAIEAEISYIEVTLPHGYTYISPIEYELDEYNAIKHLDMSTISTPNIPFYNLQELGYDDDHVSKLSSSLAQSGIFKILSLEGTRMLRKNLQALDEYAEASPRIPKVIRGAALRSAFIRDLSTCPVLTSFVSRLAGCSLTPHPMTIMHGHTNLLPSYATRHLESIDKWHYDTVTYVLVIFLSDLSLYEGGQFQYFPGTIQQAESYLRSNQPLPQELIRDVGEQHPGSAVLQQGWQVYHRDAAVSLTSVERTSFVLSYVSSNVFLDSGSILSRSCNGVDPPHVLLSDWARYRCWRAQRFLQSAIRLLSTAVGADTVSVGGGDSGDVSGDATTESLIRNSTLTLLSKLVNFRLKLLKIVKTLRFTENVEYIISTIALASAGRDADFNLRSLQEASGQLTQVIQSKGEDIITRSINNCMETLQGAINDINGFRVGHTSYGV